MERDPRKDPRPGDVVPSKHVFPQTQTLTVHTVINGEIRCLINGGPRSITMSYNQWVDWMPEKKAEAREASKVTKERWIEMYGGQAVLDREGFDVVPCVDCKDSVCHGWMVKLKTDITREASVPTAAVTVVDCGWEGHDGMSPLYDPFAPHVGCRWCGGTGKIAVEDTSALKAQLATAAEVIAAAERALGEICETYSTDTLDELWTQANAAVEAAPEVKP
jgi:hypothetical protein